MKKISMETFGPVAVDYFTGQRVTKVTEGENDAVWSIHFEGGGAVHNYDPLMPKPTAIVDAALTMTILGAHTDPETRTPVTELRFGLESVKLNPLEYAIMDPTYTHGNLVYAQRSHVNMPPEHPDERVAEGPSEPEDEGRAELAESTLPEGDVGHLLTEEQKAANRKTAEKEEERLRAEERERHEQHVREAQEAEEIEDEPDLHGDDQFGL